MEDTLELRMTCNIRVRKVAEKTQKKGFFNHWIVRNLLICFILVVVMIVGAIVFLNVVTKHNQELVVPDFSNMTVEQAQVAAAQAGMKVDNNMDLEDVYLYYFAP